eukprot:360089-Chlamydomonas_euryale.AAC.3
MRPFKDAHELRKAVPSVCACAACMCVHRLHACVPSACVCTACMRVRCLRRLRACAPPACLCAACMHVHRMHVCVPPACMCVPACVCAACTACVCVRRRMGVRCLHAHALPACMCAACMHVRGMHACALHACVCAPLVSPCMHCMHTLDAGRQAFHSDCVLCDACTAQAAGHMCCLYVQRPAVCKASSPAACKALISAATVWLSAQAASMCVCVALACGSLPGHTLLLRLSPASSRRIGCHCHRCGEERKRRERGQE